MDDFNSFFVTAEAKLTNTYSTNYSGGEIPKVYVRLNSKTLLIVRSEASPHLENLL
jgi:hypothetical protein